MLDSSWCIISARGTSTFLLDRWIYLKGATVVKNVKGSKASRKWVKQGNTTRLVAGAGLLWVLVVLTQKIFQMIHAAASMLEWNL